jgi:hypothetical protein
LEEYLDRPKESLSTLHEMECSKVVFCLLGEALPPGLHHYIHPAGKEKQYDPHRLLRELQFRLKGMSIGNLSVKHAEYQRMKFRADDDFSTFREEMTNRLHELAQLRINLPETAKITNLLNAMPEVFDDRMEYWSIQAEQPDMTYERLCDTIEASLLQRKWRRAARASITPTGYSATVSRSPDERESEDGSTPKLNFTGQPHPRKTRGFKSSRFVRRGKPGGRQQYPSSRPPQYQNRGGPPSYRGGDRRHQGSNSWRGRRQYKGHPSSHASGTFRDHRENKWPPRSYAVTESGVTDAKQPENPRARNEWVFVTIALGLSSQSLQECTDDFIPFVFDSGATSHMTCHVSALIHPQPVQDVTIQTASGGRTPATMRGVLPLTTRDGTYITLGNVLGVPELGCSLISISQLTQGQKFQVVFSDSICRISCLRWGSVVRAMVRRASCSSPTRAFSCC